MGLVIGGPGIQIKEFSLEIVGLGEGMKWQESC